MPATSDTNPHHSRNHPQARGVACIRRVMNRIPHSWAPSTHPLKLGATWRIARRSDARVALRGRSGKRVDEIRLIDAARPRRRDWASSTIVVALHGPMTTSQESHCLYRLCRAWWQRRLNFEKFNTRATFIVTPRTDGRYDVAVTFRGSNAQAAIAEHLGSPIVMTVHNPEIWETRGLQLLDLAECLLRGEAADSESSYLDDLESLYLDTLVESSSRRSP